MQTSPRWPIGTSGALGLAFLLILGHYLAFLPGGLVAIAFGLERREIWLASPAAFLVILTTGAVEIGLVLRLGMCRYARLSLREVGWRGLLPRDVAYGVIGFVLGACIALCGIAGEAGFADALGYIADKVAHYTPQQRVFFAVMAFIAVLPEETIFRGILQPTLQAKLGRAPGVVVTAIVFSVYHIQFFSLVPLLTHTFHGLLYGVLRDRTRTLWAPAIAHALTWIVLGAV